VSNKRLTDSSIASQIGLSQQAFARWKKDRKKIYSVIRSYFDNKDLLEAKEADIAELKEEIKALNDEMKRLIEHHKKVLKAIEKL